MSLRLVRCPFCGKRFNVAGIPAGNRLRCGWCTAILTVPRPDAPPEPSLRLTRSLVLQVAGGIAAGLVAAVALYLAVRPSATRFDPPPSADGGRVAKVPLAKDGEQPPNPGRDVFPKRGPDTALGIAVEAIQKEFGPRFIYYDSLEPYLVALEPSDRYHAASLSQDYGKRLETLHTAFRREFAEALKLPKVDKVLVVIVFNCRESFDRYCLERDKKKMADSIKGIYEYERERIVVYYDYNVPYEVLSHEGAHQLVHHYMQRELGKRRVPGNYWFQEGLGTYFEGLRQGARSPVIDPGAGRERLPALKQAILQPGQHDFIPVNVLVGMTVDEFWEWFEKGMKIDPEETTQKARLYYAESWALVHFLRQTGGNHQKVFDEYFRLEIRGKGDRQAFEELVRQHLNMELPELNEKFRAYIQELHP